MHKLDKFNFPYCRDQVEAYERLVKIGQGTFGEVFKARDRETKDLVALKKVLMENEKEGVGTIIFISRVEQSVSFITSLQFPITALRELRILQLLDHTNVVKLIEICRSKNSGGGGGGGGASSARNNSTFYLVFEFCEHDLAGLLNNTSIKFKLAEIKNIIQQLLYGLYYIHNSKILHRDMKAANILITKNGILKLADFGLARAFSHGNNNRYTNRVVTLWYRPPELLLGERYYGTAIDMWGAGCIMAEMWTRAPIMQGSSEQTQLNMICQLCGSITKEAGTGYHCGGNVNWPDHDKIELVKKMELPKNKIRKVRDRMKGYVVDKNALDLLDRLLTLDPGRRIDTEAALDHDFFFCDPLPVDCSRVLANCSKHMFEYLSKPHHHGHHHQHTGQQQASGQNNRRTAHQAGLHPGPPSQRGNQHRNPDQHYEQVF